jgi:hypothetical protein
VTLALVAGLTIPAAAAGQSCAGTTFHFTLTEAHGTWATNSPITGYQYRWARCDTAGLNCIPIPGAAGAAYTLGGADVGATIKVSEIASNSYGPSAPAWSDPTGQVLSGIPMNVAAPTIVGSPVEGQVLAVGRGVWSNGPIGFSYQWLRCDAKGANCRSIAGASGITYTLTVSDVRSTIRVQEATFNPFGSTAPAMSAATVPVVDAPLTLRTFALVGTVRSVVPGPVASFSDPGDVTAPPGGYTATISWGDHKTRRGRVVAGAPGSYFITAAHVYRRAGNYTLTVQLAAATGATAEDENRVSVFTAKTCPKGSSPRGRNCLGDISLPSGCIFAGDPLPVAIKQGADVADVFYTIDQGGRPVRGVGAEFAAKLGTAALKSGTHHLTARFTFRSGRPPKLSTTRPFAIC